MATESSSLKGKIESPVQLLKRLEQHDWGYSRSDDHREWKAGKQDWEEIQHGATSVPNGAAILKHYAAAWNLANYGHE